VSTRRLRGAILAAPLSAPLAGALTTLAALILCTTPASAQTTYRWIGQDGQVNYSDQPPPPGAKDPSQAPLGSPNLVDTSGPSYSEKKAARVSPVTLYTGTDCVAECKLARDYLKRRGVNYREQAVKSVADAAALRQATGSKELLVPTILVGKIAHQGFEAGAWDRLLETAGYPLQGPAPE